MPRYKTSRDSVDAEVRKRLLSALTAELKVESGTTSPDRPSVFEQAVSQTDTYHVLVVWEAWGEIPSEERGGIILEAYEQADPGIMPKITVAMGVTLEEALEMDLLPYQVMTARKNGDPVSYQQLEDAMRQEGALKTPFGIRMYFPTHEAALDAVRRLSARIPGPYWLITQTVTPEVG